MRFLAVATDYDGTLATDGRVPSFVLRALERLRASGRCVVLVTGRELPDLASVFPQIDLFDLIVAENGALLYVPNEKREIPLAEGPPPELLATLRARGVSPLSAGRVIVSSAESQSARILEAIQGLGLEWHLIFNKGSVMALPSGVNKATGLSAALRRMALSPHNIVAIGDAENDHAFLCCSELAVAVGDALPSLKQRADVVTRGRASSGVAELVEEVLKDDLATFAAAVTRHDILLGSLPDGTPITIPAYGHNVLVSGGSQAGKTTLMAGFLERLLEKKYQFCLVDPEGDYEELGDAVVLGGPKARPSLDDVLTVLANPDRSTVVNLTGFHLEDRHGFFQALFPRLQELRATHGRPHWIVVDEAHHVLSADNDLSGMTVPQDMVNVMFATIGPETVRHAAVARTDTFIVLGDDPGDKYASWSRICGCGPMRLPVAALRPREAIIARRCGRQAPALFHVAACQKERTRHRRKYAAGELPPDRSFFFKGPDGRLNLRAQNLMTFLQLADGVDDETWLHHLRQGDYSGWFRDQIHSEDLAAASAVIEEDANLSAAESRKRLRKEIEKRFTFAA